VLLTAWAIRRRGVEAVGPMFFYDLMRLARRGRSTLLRCAYALLLLAVLYLIYWNRFPIEAALENLFRLKPKMRLEELAQFAGTFATGIFALQSAAVIVLTPAYVSGAIAEEKEWRTLELLFTTHLTDREIVLGKLFGRLMHLFGVVLAGLPILMALQVWGGVEPLLPIAGFFVTVLTLLSVGSICIYGSVLCRTSFSALVASYVIVLPVAGIGVFWPGGFISSPIAFMMTLEMQLGAGQFYQMLWPMANAGAGPGPTTGATVTVVAMTMIYAIPHLLIAVFCTWSAVRELRNRGPMPPPGRRLLPIPRIGDTTPSVALASEKTDSGVWEPINLGWDPVDISGDQQVRSLEPLPRRQRYPVSDRALLWMEVYHCAGKL